MTSEKNILLSTLGKSPMIIPQAFLAEGTRFDEIHVFTTNHPEVTSYYRLLKAFFDSHSILFTLTSLEGVELPNTTALNKEFEEGLYQWYLEKSRNQAPYVCLSGGTKTIPAIMQKAAQLFGALDVFHVISDKDKGSDPKTIDEILPAIQRKQLQTVRFGTETGWHAYKSLGKSIPFTSSNVVEGTLYKKDRIIDFPLINEIKGIQERIKTYFKGNDTIELPFPGLLLLPEDKKNWLNQPLIDLDKDWVRSLPKTELHCHMGGFATHPPLLDEVRENAQYPDRLSPLKNIPYPENWPLPDTSISLREYMRLGDNNGSTLLSDPGCLRKQIELLYTRLQNEQVKYAEIRCSPYNYARFQSAWEVLQMIKNSFQNLMEQSNEVNRCHVNLIIIVSRKDEGDLSAISKHLALAVTAASSNGGPSKNSCRVVGVDLAGYETKTTRASYFQHDFVGVHRCGLAVTAHAGENDDAEAIWQAVYQLNARRIGHALHLFQAKELMQTFSDRKIAVEMCPYANYQIKGFYPMTGKENRYPLLEYIEKGIPVTVNTDNIGISSAGLTDNYLLLSKMLPEITRLDILKLIRNGIEAAFISESERKILRNEFDHIISKKCISID